MSVQAVRNEGRDRFCTSSRSWGGPWESLQVCCLPCSKLMTSFTLASMVLPLPGGPYNSSPRAGDLRPQKRSGRDAGRMTISCRACRQAAVCAGGQPGCRQLQRTAPSQSA